MNADCGHDRIRLGVDYADVVRAGVDDVNFIFLAVCRDAGGLAADPDGFRKGERSQVNHAHRVAFSVGDVGVLAVEGTVVGKRLFAEVPPAYSAEDGNYDSDEKEFSQEIDV